MSLYFHTFSVFLYLCTFDRLLASNSSRLRASAAALPVAAVSRPSSHTPSLPRSTSPRCSRRRRRILPRRPPSPPSTRSSTLTTTMTTTAMAIRALQRPTEWALQGSRAMHSRPRTPPSSPRAKSSARPRPLWHAPPRSRNRSHPRRPHPRPHPPPHPRHPRQSPARRRPAELPCLPTRQRRPPIRRGRASSPPAKK
jgi:hypothetical protein